MADRDVAAGASPPVLSYPAAFGPVVTRVLECGRGQEAVLLLHGFGSRADRWRHNIQALASVGYHVYAPDFPGHGFADKPQGFDYTTPGLAAVILDLLGRVETPAVLVGTSLGGHVASWLACAHPELVRACVLVGATGLVRREPSSAARLLDDSSIAGARRKLEFLVHDHALVTEEWVIEEQHFTAAPGAPRALSQIRDYLDQGINDQLTGERYAALDMPTLLIWGAEDRWVRPDVGRRVADLLPTAPFLLLEGAGHAPYLERPDAFNEAVIDFLTGLPEQAPRGTRQV